MIQVRGIVKSFDGCTVLQGIDLDIQRGELVALLGPSGCGKTTLLRIISGVEHPDAGEVLHANQRIDDVDPRDRNVGLVFQHRALFRHMDVFDNVAFALKVRHKPRSVIAARVSEILRLVRLTGYEHRYPHQLSGGQCQRVALARALAVEPRLLLLDEPFGALDAHVRRELREWLRRLHDQIHLTTLLVTHDQEEAFEVADRVVLMRSGRIEQIGTPSEVFDRPASPFVIQFLGMVNVFHGRVEGGRARVGNLEFAVPAAEQAEQATMYVRPHDLELFSSPGPGRFAAHVTRVAPMGGSVRVELAATGFETPLAAELDLQRCLTMGIAPGANIFASARQVRVFSTGEASQSPSKADGA